MRFSDDDIRRGLGPDAHPHVVQVCRDLANEAERQAAVAAEKNIASLSMLYRVRERAIRDLLAEHHAALHDLQRWAPVIEAAKAWTEDKARTKARLVALEEQNLYQAVHYAIVAEEHGK